MTMMHDHRDLPLDFNTAISGPLPGEWQAVKLGAVFDIQQGKALSRRNNKGIRPRPFLRTANILWGSIDLSRLDYVDFTEKEEQKYRLQPGDLLVCEGGDVGRTAIWEGQLDSVYYQNHLHRLRPKVLGVEPLFVMYWMQAAITLFNLYLGSSNKTTIANLSRSRLADFDIPLPPLPEQRAIAHVLRTAQGSKEATEQVIAALKELKKSLMRHLFTYGPVPIDQVDRVELQDTEIGPLPKHWGVKKLGDLQIEEVLWVKNGFPQGKFNEIGEGIPHLRPFNITEDGVISLSQIKYVPAPPDGSPYWLQKGDIILNNTNSESLVGKVAIFGLDGSFVLSNHMTIIRVRKPQVLNNAWLMYWLLQLWQIGFTQSLARRHVNQASISLSRLKDIPIPFPPLSEQREITRILQAVDRKIEAEENRKTALEALFKSLLHNLMTAKRRLPESFVAQFAQGSSEEAV